jgi:hypothetical protein
MEELKVSPFETFNTDFGLVAVNVNRIIAVKQRAKGTEICLEGSAGYIIVEYSFDSVMRWIEERTRKSVKSQSEIFFNKNE